MNQAHLSQARLVIAYLSFENSICTLKFTYHIFLTIRYSCLHIDSLFQHPALFGQETHHMAFNGKVDGTGQIGSISMSDGQHKVFHDSEIAAGMTFISR